MACAGCAGDLAPGGACATFWCAEARPYRERLLHYFSLQLTADLAAAAWLPIALAGGWVGLRRPAALALVVAASALPAAAVAVRIARFRAGPSIADVLAFARLRLARQTTPLYVHRHGVARFEVLVTNPLLFTLLTLAAVRAGDAAGVALAVALMAASAVLFLGPSRRLLPNPAGDLAAWLAAVEASVAAGRLATSQRVRADGRLEPAAAAVSATG